MSQDELSAIALKEKELVLKEKELELRERELRLKEEGAASSELGKKTIGNTLREICPSATEGTHATSFFYPEENIRFWSYSGVLRRKSFFLFASLIFVINLFIRSAMGVVVRQLIYVDYWLLFALVAVTVLMVLPAVFAGIKRCRDCGISLWWMLLFTFFPIAGFYLFFAKTKRQTKEQIQSSNKQGTKVVIVIFIAVVLLNVALIFRQ